MLSLLAAACGGGSEESAGTTTSRGPEPNTSRPEGSWTLAFWTTSRSDVADAPKGQAAVSRVKIEPACAEGPCEMAITADGVEGTDDPPGYPRHAEAEPFDPYELTWDGESRSYRRVAPSEGAEECVTAEGKSVDAAYDIERVWTVEFHPPESNRPPIITGTFERKATATPRRRRSGLHVIRRGREDPGGAHGFARGRRAAQLGRGLRNDLGRREDRSP